MDIFYKTRRVPGIGEILDWLIALILVISPITQHYIAVFVNAGWTLWVVAAVLIVLRMMFGRVGSVYLYKNETIAYLLLLIYYLYHLIDHGFTLGKVFTTVIILWLYFFIAEGQLNTKMFVRIATAIAVINVICMILQYICYYLFRYNLQFVDLSLLVDQDVRWVTRLSSTSADLSLYRPSGIFLEPSHAFLFSFPLILYYFTNDSPTKEGTRIAWLLMFGVLISTSGMGLVFVLAMLAAYFIMYRKPKYKRGSLWNLFTPRTLMLFLAAIIVIWFSYQTIDVVRNTINRVISTDSEGYNAISGRTSKGIKLLSQMSEDQILFGITDSMGDLGKSISGFQGEMYKYGIAGIVISYAYYVFFLLKSRKKNVKYLALALLVLSFVCAHTHRDFYMLYFGVFLFDGIRGNGVRYAEELQNNVDKIYSDQRELAAKPAEDPRNTDADALQAE